MEEKIIRKFQEALDKSYKKYFKNEEDSISLTDLDKIEKLIEKDQTLRGTIKKLLKNCDGSVINDKIILLLSNFYLKRNEKGDLETAKECLEKVINKKNPEYKLQKNEITKAQEAIIISKETEILLKEANNLKNKGKDEEAIKKYQNCIIGFYSTKNLPKISECFSEIVSLTGDYAILEKLKLLCKVIDPHVSSNNITSKDIKLAVETYFEFAEIAINNILEEDGPNKEQELNNIFRNIGHAIDGIKGDFSEINNKNDLLSSFYSYLMGIFDIDFTIINPSYELINMLHVFSKKGSVYCYGTEFNKIFIELKSKSKEDIGTERINFISREKELRKECYENNKSHFFALELLPFTLETENIDEMREIFSEYKNRLESIREDKSNFSVGCGEMYRIFNNIASNKKIKINTIKKFKKEIEELCDIYPYGFNYGNGDITDYYNIILDEKEFINIFESFKEENLSELTNDLKSKSFSDFCNGLTSKDEISKKLEKFFEKIINNEDKFEYHIFELNRVDLERLENLCPKYKGRTNKLLEKKLLEKFEKNVDFFNELSNKNEIDEDTEKEINRTLGSLIRIADIILKEKFTIPKENEEQITNLFNNLENKNIVPISTIEVYKNTLQELEDLFPNLKGRTKELLEKKLLEKFEKNVDFFNELSNKNEIDEDTEKEINRTLSSLIRTTDIILKEKFTIPKENEEQITNLFNNLENKNIVPISTIEIYKDTLQELENLFPNLKGRTEKIIENRKSIEFEYNLNSINYLLTQEINENEQKSLDKETKEKVDNLMNFIKEAMNEKIENLKVYKKELKILFINLKESKNKALSDTINEHKEELEKLKNLFNEDKLNSSSYNFVQR